MKLDFQAILQALITAAVTAAIVMYASVRVLDERVGALSRELQEVKTSVQNIQRDFYVPNNGGHNANQYYSRSAQSNQTP